MIIRRSDLAYIHAVCAALDAGSLDLDETTDVCPECEQPQTFRENALHLVVPTDATCERGRVAVVIACEGYRVINPGLVGIDQPNWQDWRTDQPGVTDTAQTVR